MSIYSSSALIDFEIIQRNALIVNEYKNFINKNPDFWEKE